jgi:DNA-binding PadR family transcriptional regulator
MRSAAAAFGIELALLGFVYERPVHGYEIYQQLSGRTGLWQVWRLKQSQLYALLTKLEDAGYLAATLQQQDARPPRKVYQPTGAGRDVFENWLATPVAHGRQMRIEFLAKLYFARHQSTAATIHLLEQQMAACHAWLLELRGAPELEPETDFFGYAVHQFRLNQAESFITWLATCRHTLLIDGTCEE